jgi:hypothetical protein
MITDDLDYNWNLHRQAYPIISAYILAFLCNACSYSSNTTIPAPSPKIKPDLY